MVSSPGSNNTSNGNRDSHINTKSDGMVLVMVIGRLVVIVIVIVSVMGIVLLIQIVMAMVRGTHVAIVVVLVTVIEFFLRRVLVSFSRL